MLSTTHPLSVRFKGADLSGQNLSGWCFVRADMTGTNLTGCNLSGADFCGALLRDADMSGVVLDGTSLVGADLRGANVSGWLCRDLQGFHVRGWLLDYLTVDAKSITGAHDCHELVAAILLKAFPGDVEMEQVCESIIARLIPCWHGLVHRLRQAWPHRIADIEATFTQYPNMRLTERWGLGLAMADCKTIEDWEALRGTVHEERFPALMRGWILRTKRERGLL